MPRRSENQRGLQLLVDRCVYSVKSQLSKYDLTDTDFGTSVDLNPELNVVCCLDNPESGVCNYVVRLPCRSRGNREVCHAKYHLPPIAGHIRPTS